MKYKELNRNHRYQMRSLTKTSIKMEWDDSNILELFSGDLPRIRTTMFDLELSDELTELRTIYDSYDPFRPDGFKNRVETIIDKIHNHIKRWNGVSIRELDDALSIHSSCLIKGPGGIGKSYFVFELEAELEKRGVEHLCVYGKFLHNNEIDALEIIDSSDNGFVLVIDAINEVPLSMQQSLIDTLNTLKDKSTIRLILTYRTGGLIQETLDKYLNLVDFEYDFPGIAFESAIDLFSKKGINEFFEYEDILYSNNALLLKMLVTLLEDKKDKGSLASITYIYERYIRKSVEKIIPKGPFTKTAREIWFDTKIIADWLYRNPDHYGIPESVISSIINNHFEYIEIMKQGGFLDSFTERDAKIYYFTIQTLNDYLICRSMFEALKDKSIEEQILIIDECVDDNYNYNEPIILLLFDKYKNDYEIIKYIIERSKLAFDYDAVKRIRFEEKQITQFQTIFKPNEVSSLLLIFGGLSRTPFNCSNYLNEYYLDSKQQLYELSTLLSGYNLLEHNYIQRLKCILYRVSYFETSYGLLEEAFWLSIWSTASPNKDVRLLATKLLFEVVQELNDCEKLINVYPRIKDEFIKESIIQVLSSINCKSTKKFFMNLKLDKDYLSAKSIRRISEYCSSKYDYIEWERENLYKPDLKKEVSNQFEKVLLKIDMFEKYRIPLRFWSSDHVDYFKSFYSVDKIIIKKINERLMLKYKESFDINCAGCSSFENLIKTEFDTSKWSLLDSNALLNSFELVFVYFCNIYEIVIDDYLYLSELDMVDSLFLKIIDISASVFWGSLMCNYYTSSFATFNNNQNSIGFEVYDPFEYDESFNIFAPIAFFNEDIDCLNKILLSGIHIPEIKDDVWHKNVELTKENMLFLTKPISFKNEEWVLLGGDIRLNEKEGYTIKWGDYYLICCCVDPKETITTDYNHTRFLTIEIEDYRASLFNYVRSGNFGNYCQDIPAVSNASDVFEETHLVFPPSNLLSSLSLSYDKKKSAWISEEGELVVICNNNPSTYYEDQVSSSLYIKKKYLDKYLENNDIKYFGFSERLLENKGYCPETEIHFEIQGSIEKTINNGDLEYKSSFRYCDSCPYGIQIDDFSSKKLQILIDEL